MSRNPTTHDPRTVLEPTDAPAELDIGLGSSTDEGLLWLEHYGEYSDAGEPIIGETHVRTAD